ncbi:glycogen synthase GlgA [Primorskyibacter marinus]|uniref:glycogen synthase GlgA n=1 Tax=Primorskyibacter marinus TaxID=1977320 RepID=UPI0018E4F5EB|nr:glycogen synthase GlgA [Primorskyibacter marinus]
MNILSVTSECVPLIKTGGLADVAGALPKAMVPLGHRMRVLMPAYPGLAARLKDPVELWQDEALFGGPARVLGGKVDGVEFLLLEAAHLFDRKGGPYLTPEGHDWPDNPERFAALSWAAARIAQNGVSDGWVPDILHAHDWQAGLTPAYLRFIGDKRVKTMMTIHNIAFQGLAPADRLASLRLPFTAFNADDLEYYGQISTLKAGLVHADAITTVSPTYAAELMRPEFGMGLEGLIATRAVDLHGILNGIDLEVWNPEACAHPYSAKTLTKKAVATAALRDRFELAETDGPLAIVVSRLTGQKGLDLLPGLLPEFIAHGGTLALLGSGDAALEAAYTGLAKEYPGKIGVHIGYDEDLSQLMFAGGDAVLIPSRFEPCGLTQLYGLRFGTLPVVAATGGLADTVIHANDAALDAGVATGLAFHPTDATAFSHSMRRLCTLFADRKLWQQMMRNAMRQPVGWENSSARYAALYQDLLG